MKSPLRIAFLVALPLVAALQSTPLAGEILSVSGVKVNLVFLLALFATLRCEGAFALLFAPLAGASCDLLSTAPMGFSTASFTITFAALPFLKRFTEFRPVALFLALAFSGSLVKALVEASILGLWLGREIAVGNLAFRALPEVLLDTLAALPLWGSWRLLSRLRPPLTVRTRT